MLKALIIDEEIDIWFMLSGVLRQHQIKTIFVNNLSAAKQSLQKEAPGMLFLDHHMQDGFGVDFIRYVKEKYPGVKIIVVKNKEGIQSSRSTAEDAADLFISKPFNADVIDKAIREII